MYDTGKVLAGLVVFVLFFTLPFWYNAATGKRGYQPEIVIPATDLNGNRMPPKCIESKEWMRANHMQLLVEWRNEVVRNGNRVYTASDGTRYNMSLTNACMNCHHNYEQFCRRCHTYQAVTPVCWDCHLRPGEN